MRSAKKIMVGGGNLPFSSVVKDEKTIYVSGVIGRDAENGMIPFSVADQTEIIMNKLQNLLKQAGSCLDNALKVTIFVTDMRYFADVNVVYKRFFSDGMLPARSCVAVAGLPDAEAKVEIEVIAEASS